MSGILAVSSRIASNLVCCTSSQRLSSNNQQRPASFASSRSGSFRTSPLRPQRIEFRRIFASASRSSELDIAEVVASPAATISSDGRPSVDPLVSLPTSSLLSLLSLLPLIVADRVLAEPVPLFENGADVLTAAGSGETVTNGVISLLFVVAVVGLVVLTGGVGYLVYTEWADKKEMEKLAAAEPVKRPSATAEMRTAMKSPPRATPKGFGKRSEKEDEESDA